jgi:23S rRNA (guanine2445-N2)-methyltransferase / 23S rRNA (guanine2069-N7)-methyltransferase
VSFSSWAATCPRGAEPALAGELGELGGKGIRPGRGIVRFTGERELALRACLSLRCALRVLQPVGDFVCDGPEALYDGSRSLPWEEWLARRQTVAVQASGRAPGLDHTGFVALRIKDALCDRLREVRGERPDVDPEAPDVCVVAHLGRGRCSLSLDLAGGLLSDRGYRVASVEAPLREALASAVLRLSGWDRSTPLADPVCGSGTLAIEAALWAAGRPLTRPQPLACERWPAAGEGDRKTVARLRAELVAEARRREAAGLPPILASDRDAAAVEAARRNVEAAGLSGLVRVEQRDARAIEPLGATGQLVLNVPYGERLDVGGRKALKSFYHSLGAALRKLRGHRAAILCGSDELEGAFGVRPEGRPLELWNGPLRCRLFRYELRG